MVLMHFKHNNFLFMYFIYFFRRSKPRLTKKTKTPEEREKMKYTMIALGLLLAATAAHADGFECQTVDQDLNIKVYNHTSPSEGTRVASVMVLSDPSVSAGKKTI